MPPTPEAVAGDAGLAHVDPESRFPAARAAAAAAAGLGLKAMAGIPLLPADAAADAGANTAAVDDRGPPTGWLLLPAVAGGTAEVAEAAQREVEEGAAAAGARASNEKDWVEGRAGAGERLGPWLWLPAGGSVEAPGAAALPLVRGETSGGGGEEPPKVKGGAAVAVAVAAAIADPSIAVAAVAGKGSAGRPLLPKAKFKPACNGGLGRGSSWGLVEAVAAAWPAAGLACDMRAVVRGGVLAAARAALVVASAVAGVRLMPPLTGTPDMGAGVEERL